MLERIFKKLNSAYPQNFIMKHPFYGSAVFMLFSFIFLITYIPLQTHQSRNLSYGATMAVYMLSSGTGTYFFIRILKSIPYFSRENDWSFIKEILSLFFILTGSGIFLYLMGFLMEDPGNRWNLATLIDSCKIGFLIGIIPLGFSTLVHYRHLFLDETSIDYKGEAYSGTTSGKVEKIHITSRLKKEDLSFFPDELIYAESEGNYVSFHLADGKQCRKELIRNSMNEIEKQLSPFKFFIRVHRAFIVNTRRVRSRKGNTLGYKLRLDGAGEEIPVSRQNVQSFDILMELNDPVKAKT